MLVSIIIPVKAINDYIRESIPHILDLDYQNFEILVFPDKKSDETFPKTRIIPTGPIGPAKKRDLALKHARGSILAFLDDDAFPRKDWLTKAIRHFDNQKIGAVGGPAVTPPNDSLKQKASGIIYSSIIGSGGAGRYRYVPGRIKFVDDFPTVNLLVRKKHFKRLGGFGTKYWPGEDTVFCHDLVYKLKKKILYDPKVLVYHHRRSVFKDHLRQIKGYALHRGYFVKRFPKTSIRLGYFMPSLFVLGLFFGWTTLLFNPILFYIYSAVVLIYLVAIFIESISMDRKIAALVVPAMILHHITYGIFFIVGLVSPKMIR